MKKAKELKSKAQTRQEWRTRGNGANHLSCFLIRAFTTLHPDNVCKSEGTDTDAEDLRGRPMCTRR